MTTDWYAPTRLLIAALLVVAAMAVPGAAKTVKPSKAARAKHALRALGYRDVHVTCARKKSCRWRAVAAGRSCAGVIRTPRRRGGPMHVSRLRCSPEKIAARPPVLFGFNTYTTSTTLAKQLAVGATITRLFVRWSQVERTPGVWNWSATDSAYGQIVAAGMRPLVVVTSAPCWAESKCSVTFGSPPSPSHDSGWTAYVRAVASRYPQAVGIEVWNEPNLASVFYPQADPARYTQLLQEAYTAVKSVHKSMPVISGGLAMNDGSGVAGPGYASRTFLTDMFADGAARWMDGIGIHVYPIDIESDGTKVWDPAAMPRWLAQVKDVEAKAGVANLPIWVTEMGVSTTTEHGFPRAATPAQQASYLSEMIETARDDPDVRAAVIDSLQDAAPNLVQDAVSNLSGSLINWDIFYNQANEGLGIFATNWTPKPAACAVSKAWGGSLSC
jgi:hypothetical protein